MIGGDAALNILVQYASDGRQRVDDELIRAWENFDGDEYARRLFVDRRGLRLPQGVERIPALDSLVGPEKSASYWNFEDFWGLPNIVDCRIVATRC
jgi:hypothetical protein